MDPSDDAPTGDDEAADDSAADGAQQASWEAGSLATEESFQIVNQSDADDGSDDSSDGEDDEKPRPKAIEASPAPRQEH